MTRLTDADALYTELVKMKDFGELTAKKAIRVVEKAPTIDAEPVRHGKWIPHEDEDGERYGDNCSECGEWYVMPYGKTNFCPHCGARMDKE